MIRNSFYLILMVLFFGCNPGKPGQNREKQFPYITDDNNYTVVRRTGNIELDSLIQLTNTLPRDSNLFLVYQKIVYLLDVNDLEMTTDYLLKIRNLSEELDWIQGRYFFAVHYGLALSRQGLTDSALVVALHAYEIAKNKDDIYSIHAKSFMALTAGNAYFTKGWYEMALQYYMEVLDGFETLGTDSHNYALINYQISQLYAQIGDNDKAIIYGDKALSYEPDDPYTLSGLGIVYANKQQYQKSNEYFTKSLPLSIEYKDDYVTSEIYIHLAENARNDMDCDLNKAKEYANNALKISSDVGNNKDKMLSLCALSQIEKMKGNFVTSEGFIQEALKIATELNELDGLEKCYRTLAELATAQKNMRDYVHYSNELTRVLNEKTTETRLRSIGDMEAKYALTEKDLELERRNAVINYQNMQRLLLISGVIVLAVFLFLLFYMLRLRIRRNRALTERSNTLAEINATKDKFFSIISHDLKNPAIDQRNAVQMLIENGSQWNAATLQKYYGKLLKSAENEVELIYNLLNWAQVQTDRLPFNPIPFDIVSNLSNDIAIARNLAEKKNITLHVETNNAPSVPVIGDSTMICTVVRNLLTNAVKFTPVGGEVTLTVSGAHTGAPLQKTRITVADTGLGMTAEQISDLFRLDRKHTSSGTAGETGSGLGLIVCKELIEKHGSILNVESEPGQGSRFWFEI